MSWIFLIVMVLGAAALGAPRDVSALPAPTLRVLVFSKTSGFRHSSIVPGLDALHQLGTDNGFGVVVTEDAASFTSTHLDAYAAVVFLSTTGDVLDPDQQVAFENYIRNGGGYVGIHSAADTEYDWAWYGGLVGAYFLSHPQPQVATLLVDDHVHESTAHLGDTWERFDEWYDFRDDPSDRVHVLLSVDPTTLPDSQMIGNHPIAWCHDYDGGHAWYTALGHTDESWAEPAFLQHVLGGIRSAAGVAVADCSAADVIDSDPTPPSTASQTTATTTTTTTTASTTTWSGSQPSVVTSEVNSIAPSRAVSAVESTTDGPASGWATIAAVAAVVALVAGTLLIVRRRHRNR